MHRGPDFAAGGAEHERVDHQPVVEAVADARAILEPGRIGKRVRRDRPKFGDIERRARSGAEPISNPAGDVRLEVAEEEMGILRADPGDIERVETGCAASSIGVRRETQPTRAKRERSRSTADALPIAVDRPLA
jgi:hypothetical protein